jgi:vacuolar-type H+-ATPase subunit H
MADATTDRLDELQSLVETAKAVPMSASCMINRADALALIAALRSAVADDIAAAAETAQANPPEVERARAEADQIVRAAKRRADELVSASEVLTTARRRADELDQRAIADAEELRKEADLYVDGRMAAMEAGLQKTLTQVQTMRSRLAERSGLDD